MPAKSRSRPKLIMARSMYRCGTLDPASPLPIKPSCFRSSSRPTMRSRVRKAALVWGSLYRSASLRCTAAGFGSSRNLAKARPDLILMGIQLPIMDGYEVTRQIKADPAMRSIPIIAVTSHALDGEEQTARAAGCDGYVPEPYSPRQLLAKIQQCLPQ